MKIFYKFFLNLNLLGSKSTFKVYSSIFRVFVCIIILKQMLTIWQFVPLLYEKESFLVPSNSMFFGLFSPTLLFIREHIYTFLGIYIGIVILYLFGIGKYIIAFLTFICFDMLQRICPEILNGGDNLLKFLLLYLTFIDSYNYLSIAPINIKSFSKKHFVNFLSNVFGFCICIHLSLIYFLAAIHKIHSDVWFHGVATYYTFNLERFSGTPYNSYLSKIPLFVTITTYFTILVEMFYPTLVWFKQTKKVIIILMIILHINIYAFMMIYDFQIIFIMSQGFFFSNEQWINFIKKYFPKKIIDNKIIYAKGR